MQILCGRKYTKPHGLLFKQVIYETIRASNPTYNFHGPVYGQNRPTHHGLGV
jgi:hypothetical protein